MQQDVSAFYNQTQNHYQRWWKLSEGMSLHYGLWYEETKNFLEALENTNKYMANISGLKNGERVLDAGCGVGGAAIFLAQNFEARVTGISLSELQISTAGSNATRHEVADLATFQLCDYADTHFEDACFDLIWACESSSSGPDKEKMLKEWYRLLKPGGRVILLDFFKSPNLNPEKDNLIKKWCDLWAMSPLVSAEELASVMTKSGFVVTKQEKLTANIVPTIKWMYKSYLLGSIPAMLYNLLFGARKYSKNHYKSGHYQYKAYKKGLWDYYAFLAVKK